MMTPERIEEIKEEVRILHPEMQVIVTVAEMKWLLAALEEAQQPPEKWEHIARTERSIHMTELAEAQQTIARKQLYIEKLECSREYAQEAADKISKEKGLELFEARQTIARQQRAWQELKDIVSTNATGGKGEDINDYDIMLNIMGDLEGDQP
ncbi:hypothetical protein NST07_20705 [Paenibacillus sp. FSL L8-0340]|uniref:hypothetical protein n=1 Tax=Paenibacillus sp. FSL L8-0340 TaxID=2954685 RepID=UPI00315923E5